jgi:tetratricopeptide (TPR) repeat protein
MGGEHHVDFFISHAGVDLAWAEWVAWQLEDHGYTVELDKWDWVPGRNFIVAISDALERCERVVALFSARYFDRERYTREEWAASLSHAWAQPDGKLVPLRIEDVPRNQVPALLQSLLSVDIFGMPEDRTRRVLLDAVAEPRRPGQSPTFPGRGQQNKSAEPVPRLPGALPPVWNVPARNPGFTGRESLLADIRKQLLSNDKAVVQALQGMGGVGKTQLAIEYAYRFGGTYDLVWWIDAERAGLIGDQFAALASEMGCTEPGAGTEAVRSAVLRELRKLPRWLLVFDNARKPVDLEPWLPSGGGHVLITSRERTWSELALAVDIDVLSRSESVAIFRARVKGMLPAAADRLAAELGDLPLGIIQGAGFIATTGTPEAEYLQLLRTQASQVLSEGKPASYPRSLAAATRLTIGRLAKADPAAAELANLCAFLAPEPIPDELFTNAADALPATLAVRAAERLAWRRTLAQLNRQSLVRIDERGLQMHRLTQAIIRDSLMPDQVSAARTCTEAVLAASHPGNTDDPACWPVWARLMPHLLVADLAGTSNSRLRDLACGASEYLAVRGDVRTSYELTSGLYQSWRPKLGEDHPQTLRIAYYLAWSLRLGQRYKEARKVDWDILERYRRIFGEDDPATLGVTNHYAMDLQRTGDLDGARDLYQDTLARSRRVLGDEDLDTVGLSINLAGVLRELGELQEALSLDEKALGVFCRVSGENHPYTLEAMHSVAADLYELGNVQGAYELEQEVVARSTQVRGEDDRLTLIYASSLAGHLRALGEMRAARDLISDVLSRRRRTLGENHPSTKASMDDLADVELALGETEGS